MIDNASSSSQGYIDFESNVSNPSGDVKFYWGFGVGISLVVMCAAFAFIVVEYCTQSHLSTEDYAKAARGLRWTRWYKKQTFFVRTVTNSCVSVVKTVCHKALGGTVERGRRSLVWHWKTGIPAAVTDESE